MKVFTHTVLDCLGQIKENKNSMIHLLLSISGFQQNISRRKVHFMNKIIGSESSDRPYSRISTLPQLQQIN